MESESQAVREPNKKNPAQVENGITIREPNDKKTAGRLNPKISVFREFALATAHALAVEHSTKQCSLGSSEGGKRQFFACDLIAQSGIAGLQWKKQLGNKIHVTVVEQRDPQPLQDNIQENGFTVCPLPLDPKRPAGTLLPEQSSSELHLAQCDPVVLMQLESFDFVYLDPHKNPAPYFSSIFRNVRNGGVVCFVVPDTMHFARSPHVVQRCYGAHCMKTEYLKELAVRIILAALAMEAAKCNKALTVLYAICLEDFLLLAVRVVRGPKQADNMLQQNIGHVLHCRICEERAFYPAAMAPVENPYRLITCDCQKNIPGKTGVILGPLWKGSIYEYSCLTQLAASGRTLKLSSPFFTLLQRVMEDCLCDVPPSLHALQKGLDLHDSGEFPCSGSGDTSSLTHQGKGQSCACNKNDNENGNDVCRKKKGQDIQLTDGDSAVTSDSEKCETLLDTNNENAVVQGSQPQSPCGKALKHVPAADTDTGEPHGVKRPASVADIEESKLPSKRSKGINEPAPCFFYNMHSKRLGTNHLPKHQAVIEQLRGHGYRCCRTHFEKYAIRTNADLKTLIAVLGTAENKVLYVKGSQQNV